MHYKIYCSCKITVNCTFFLLYFRSILRLFGLFVVFEFRIRAGIGFSENIFIVSELNAVFYVRYTILHCAHKNVSPLSLSIQRLLFRVSRIKEIIHLPVDFHDIVFNGAWPISDFCEHLWHSFKSVISNIF